MIAGYPEIVAATNHIPALEVMPPGREATDRIGAIFSSLTADQVLRRNLENFHAALVMFRNSRDEALSGPDTGLRTAEVLLLPWTWKELLSRIESEERVPQTGGKNYVAQFGHVRVELSSMEVRRGEFSVRLTAMEFKVLRFFLQNPNRVISRDQLLNEVWGYGNYPYTRTVDNHIMRLRRKLESDPSKPSHFQTVRGIGYKFVPHTLRRNDYL